MRRRCNGGLLLIDGHFAMVSDGAATRAPRIRRAFSLLRPRGWVCSTQNGSDGGDLLEGRRAFLRSAPSQRRQPHHGPPSWECVTLNRYGRDLNRRHATAARPVPKRSNEAGSGTGTVVELRVDAIKGTSNA